MRSAAGAARNPFCSSFASTKASIGFAALFMTVMFAMMLAPVAGILLVVTLLGRDAQRRQFAAFTDLAARVRGEVVQRKAALWGYPIARAVVFQYGQVPCVLDVEVVGSGKHRRYFTRLTFDLERFVTFQCRITPEHALSALGSLLGEQDVRLGWEEFDQSFVVKANDELRAPDILHRPVQQALLQLRSEQRRQLGFGIVVGYVDLRVQGRLVQFRTLGRPTSGEQLLAAIQSFARVFDLLSPRLAEGKRG